MKFKCFIFGIWAMLGLRTFAQVDSLKETVPVYDLGPVLIVLQPSHLGEGAGISHYYLDSLARASSQLGNAADMMRQLPGLSLKQYAPSGLATVSMRGTGAGHTQIYWEGMPLNGAILGQFDFATTSGSLFSKMESLPGGASLGLGSGGIGGAIQLSNPVSAWRTGNQLNVSAQYGSFENLATQSLAELRVGRIRWIGQGYFNQGLNNFPYRDFSQAQAPEKRMEGAAVQGFGTMQTLAFPVRKGQIRANIWAFRNQRHIPPPLLVSSGSDFQEDRALRSSFAYEGAINPFWGNFVAQLGANWEQLDYQPSLAPRSENRSTQLLAQFQTYQAHKRFEKRWYSPGLGLRIMHQTAQAGSSLENIQRILGSGHFSIGRRLRKDMVFEALVRQDFTDKTLPGPQARLGMQLPIKLLRNSSLFANLNRLIRLPSLSDLYWSPGGNPSLRPESSLGFELGLKLPVFREGRRYGLQAAYFLNRVQDWILWTPNSSGIWSAGNVRAVLSQGLELQYTMGYEMGRHRAELLLNYAFVDSRDDQGFQLIYNPRHNAFARLSWRWRGFSAQLQHNQNSRRYITADNSDWLTGFGTTDASLGYLVRFARQQFDFQLGMRNLADVEYQMVAQRPLPGRSGFIRIDWTFK